MDLKHKLRKYFVNVRGWSTNRKIVVIESDDWGSIRMPSTEVYNYLLKNGIPVDVSRYTRYDTVESREDMERLYEVLDGHRDINGRSCVFTTNSVVANPDFKKIESSEFKEYHFETVTETYDSYNGAGFINLLKQGMEAGLIYPQYHGREHLNTRKWLSILRGGDEKELLAFSRQSILGTLNTHDRSKMYMAAFEYVDEAHKAEIEEMTKDGLEIFESVFGFKSQSFVASQSIRGDHLDRVLSDNAVRFHQCGQQLIPGGQKLQLKNRYWGARNQHGMYYWRRNVTFEPSKDQQKDSVSTALKEIDIAFKCGKPAVINSHRVNYTGRLSENNREDSLQKLGQLLKAVERQWPQVEFMSSESLGKLMAAQK